jgi:hypothetical protein
MQSHSNNHDVILDKLNSFRNKLSSIKKYIQNKKECTRSISYLLNNTKNIINQKIDYIYSNLEKDTELYRSIKESERMLLIQYNYPLSAETMILFLEITQNHTIQEKQIFSLNKMIEIYINEYFAQNINNKSAPKDEKLFLQDMINNPNKMIEFTRETLQNICQMIHENNDLILKYKKKINESKIDYEKYIESLDKIINNIKLTYDSIKKRKLQSLDFEQDTYNVDKKTKLNSENNNISTCSNQYNNNESNFSYEKDIGSMQNITDQTNFKNNNDPSMREFKAAEILEFFNSLSNINAECGNLERKNVYGIESFSQDAEGHEDPLENITIGSIIRELSNQGNKNH